MNFHTVHHTDSGDMTQIAVDGHHVGTSIKNIFGGHDLFGAHGDGVLSTKPNVMGGEDIAHNGHPVGHTSSDGIGGKFVYDSHGHQVGHATPDGLGGENLFDGAHLQAHFNPSHDGFQTVMTMSDPLMHLHLYQLPPLFGFGG